MEFNSNVLAYNIFKKRENECLDYIDSLSDEIILANSNELVLEDAISKYEYEPICISDEILEKRNIFEKEIDNPVYFLDTLAINKKIKGIHFQFFHSYNGSFELLKYRASSSFIWQPNNIEAFGGTITFFYDKPYQENIDKIKDDVLGDYNNDLSHFKNLIFCMNSDINLFNKNLKIKVEKKINERRCRILKLHELSKKMAIPLKKRVDAPNYTPIKVVKKSVSLSTKIQKEDEYYIPENDYKEINRRISHCGASMERVPTTYSDLNEEQLRDIVVSHMNVDYEGQVQGESFRNKGKSDICVEYNNRSAFVTECKIWKGKSIVKSTVQQLLSYTTWKDSKLGIIFFNKKNKDFFAVIDVLQNELKELENFVSLRNISKNEFELILNSDNSGQRIFVHIFIFNLFVEKKYK